MAHAPGALFGIGEEPIHSAGDPHCPGCWEEYPAPCQCGGLMHAEASGQEDPDGNPELNTMCDRCGRSEEQSEEP